MRKQTQRGQSEARTHFSCSRIVLFFTQNTVLGQNHAEPSPKSRRSSSFLLTSSYNLRIEGKKEPQDEPRAPRSPGQHCESASAPVPWTVPPTPRPPPPNPGSEKFPTFSWLESNYLPTGLGTAHPSEPGEHALQLTEPSAAMACPLHPHPTPTSGCRVTYLRLSVPKRKGSQSIPK